MPRNLFYLSGEEIRKGDKILLSGHPGEIELVAVNPDDPEEAWYIREFGGGVMILEATMGRVFIDAAGVTDDEDLEFVSRAVEEA